VPMHALPGDSPDSPIAGVEHTGSPAPGKRIRLRRAYELA
jgi:hypothetical protein